MSIFDDIGKEAKHATHSVTHTGEQAFNQIKHATEGAVMEVNHAASDGVNKVKQEVEKGIHSLKGELPQLEGLAEAAVSKVIVPVVSDLMEPLEKIVFTVGKDVLEETHYAIKKVFDASTSSTDRSILIHDFNKINFYIANTGTVSIGLYFTNMWDRAPEIIRELRNVEKGIPAKRHAIMEFVEKIGPDRLDITISAKIPIVQIGGSIGAWGIPASLFEHLLDDVLKKAGVPD